MAWERTDQFRRVISHIGSFTNIRGCHAYPSFIRQAAVRPIRVFLQDGHTHKHGGALLPALRWLWR